MNFFKKKDDTSQLEKLIADYRRGQSPNTLHQMLELFPKIPLYYSSLSPEFGPDNLPYVNLYLRAQSENHTALKELAQKALQEGFGATINKSTNHVDWVFSLGDFIPLARAGILVSNDGQVGLQSNVVTKDVKVQVGAPNEDIIPTVVRKHLRSFIQTNLKISDPKFYLMLNPKDNPPWTMMFNFSRKDFGSDAEYQNAFGYLQWFFPKTVFVGCIENDKNQFYEI
jgi:hypothetical protein